MVVNHSYFSDNISGPFDLEVGMPGKRFASPVSSPNFSSSMPESSSAFLSRVQSNQQPNIPENYPTQPQPRSSSQALSSQENLESQPNTRNTETKETQQNHSPKKIQPTNKFDPDSLDSSEEEENSEIVEKVYETPIIEGILFLMNKISLPKYGLLFSLFSILTTFSKSQSCDFLSTYIPVCFFQILALLILNYTNILNFFKETFNPPTKLQMDDQKSKLNEKEAESAANRKKIQIALRFFFEKLKTFLIDLKQMKMRVLRQFFLSIFGILFVYTFTNQNYLPSVLFSILIFLLPFCALDFHDTLISYIKGSQI
ncbi:hypothetical protein TRFO_29829 [Tritrichomonas foetus]|uniref:Uncharacterized protein n=1 Tax=Tritrichomonas foetus TaxID=1144522 RepID=A0A1J4JUW6_9EUKA|nr:hypothetical protein TRFO_29829 [Tritrichomonas foetus]|eukprot:OHT02951.1 hypothetical protein TRFO_29829 [Tritrichomonas foetus]